jgi:hypothetical protein
VQLTPSVALGVRLAAALGTLALAWRVQRTGSSRSFAVAVLVLSGCYITLFGPRNEFLSFIVLTPSLAILAGLMLIRDDADYRGWRFVRSATLGFAWSRRSRCSEADGRGRDLSGWHGRWLSRRVGARSWSLAARRNPRQQPTAMSASRPSLSSCDSVSSRSLTARTPAIERR